MKRRKIMAKSVKLKLNVGEFKTMVAKAVKGCSSNADILMTQLMAVELKDGVLRLITTDYSNYLYVQKDKVAGDDFYVVVYADKFARLISKLTSENVELSVKVGKGNTADCLVVKADGNYSLELPYDENGELIQFPDPVAELSDDMQEAETKLSTLRLIMTTAKPSVLPTNDRSSGSPYTGYFMGRKAVTTDTFSMCGIDIEMFDPAVLIHADLVNLLDTLVKEDVKVKYNDTDIVFMTDDVVVYGKLMDNVDEFPVDAVESLLDEPYPSTCKVDTEKLVKMLDRLALFINERVDHGEIDIKFTSKGISISSKSQDGEEIIPYVESNNFSDFECSTSLGVFNSIIKANHAAQIEIMYGKDTGLKIVEGNVKQIIPFADDDSEETEDEDNEE